MEKEQVHLHTSDRVGFKRCRRKWHFASPLKENLEPIRKSSGPLWLGSGIHWVLEDWHGYRKFATMEEAFQAYYKVFPEEELPPEVSNLYETGIKMLDYYKGYTEKKPWYKTVWIEGVPQVEVGFSIPIPELDTAEKEVFYHGTFDKVVEDEYGNWYILDYKTAAAIDTNKLTTDPQISAYLWAAEIHYSKPIAGLIYLQMVKSTPSQPKILKSGDVSKDKAQRTTHALYREALIKAYGKVPQEYIDILNHYAELETPEGNSFIRIDVVERNKKAKLATYQNIIAEGKDMLNSELSIYPNPTRDCMWDCPFRTVCLTIDEGGEYESWIGYEFQKRNQSAKQELPAWRQLIEDQFKSKEVVSNNENL